jgi:hypothetical protein
MKRSIFAIVGFCVVLGYQNCGRSQFGDVSSNDAFSNPTEVQPVEKIDVAQTRVVEVPENAFLEGQLQAPIEKAAPTSALASHHLEIDVKTGVIDVLDQNNTKTPGLQYCLNAQDLDRLTAILASAKICEESAPTDSGLNCTMNYQFPYARLHLADAEVPLGESMSGCHHGPDLCGDQKGQMQALLADVQTGLTTTRTCNFQIVVR